MIKADKIKAPTRKQLFNLRAMMLIGIGTMIFFLYNLLSNDIAGYKPLYWLLVITLVFTCLKIATEWYHYWYITVPPTPPAGKEFTVDIFTTFCKGEPYEMIEETLLAIKAIKYPHTTYLCDEANDPYLKDLCDKFDIRHVTRVRKINAKAGNINNALQQATGDLCVVLDPDHVPFPDFLDPIVSHFNNPKVGFVQIVQSYFNQGQGLVAKGAAQQTYQFYGPMMMCMNKYGTVLAIGANCTFRRKALDSIGGHAAGLAEDMHTAMQLHAKGWESVYVPQVLAEGLVPATLSAYFKQQLKWSRGVFELFVTTYFDLFKKFTWRQKLHYGIIPLFYLSGVIFLINFLIPVISLFAGVYPLRIAFTDFLVISTPFIASMVLIRHYVQRWVVNDDERGFHVVGGLLLIGTWWIFNLGLIYTIIRKDVPYIPTPKDVTDENNLKINMPNIIVLLVSVAAIIFGLYTDWNPFTVVMACIASINCLFMVFIIFAGEQHKFRQYQSRHQMLSSTIQNVDLFKRRFWLFRRRIYSGVRSIALLLIIFTVCSCVYILNFGNRYSVVQQAASGKKNIFLSGIFAPADSNGLSSLKQIKKYQAANKSRFDIVSFYIPWGNRSNSFLPLSKLDSTYKNGSVPMITWEPWQTLFDQGEIKYNEKKVFEHIVKGEFDDYIKSFAAQIKGLNKPVFLRFAHEADNPFYPWSSKGGNTPAEFKAAWQHVYNTFVHENVYNAVWVWNPWKPNAVKDYYPGDKYVDWIGVTGLNFGPYNADKKSYSFEQLYTPYHRLPVFKSGKPVMIAEMGSLKAAGNQEKWFKDGLAQIKTKFKEVKGFVLFNSALGKNTPHGETGMLNWQVINPATIATLRSRTSSLRLIKPTVKDTSGTAVSAVPDNRLFASVRGVNYTKGQHWYKNTIPLNKKIVLEDFSEMRKAGINTVKLFGPTVYDNTMFEAAEEVGLNIHYSFWMPDGLNFVKDKDKLNEKQRSIIETITALAGHKNITSWNIGNSTIQQLAYGYYTPELYYQEKAYLQWLKTLVKGIKKADPTRPVTVDVLVSPTVDVYTRMIHDAVPEIDSYGLILPEKPIGLELINKLSVPHFYSNANVKNYLGRAKDNAGAFINNWQDVHTASLITFDGVKDIWGHNKPQLYQISKLWDGKMPVNNLPPVKILRPSFTTKPGSELIYNALIYNRGKWNLAGGIQSGITFKWYLVGYDGGGTALGMRELGTGTKIKLTIPENPSYYALYLVGQKGENVVTTQSILNTPLY
jgi:cellulose synthase (UDP-forming)